MPIRRPIIVVDDDEDDRQLIAEALNDLGIPNPVMFFVNTAEAMKFLANDGQPLIIISDINMPVENGIEFKKRIDSNPALRKKCIPFVFLSTVAQKSVVEAAYTEFTVQGFFLKPDGFSEYRSLMRNILSYWAVCKHPNG